MIKVEVTWMDGQQVVYHCGEVRSEDGVLRLIQHKHQASDEPQRNIPLANVRIWMRYDR